MAIVNQINFPLQPIGSVPGGTPATTLIANGSVYNELIIHGAGTIDDTGLLTLSSSTSSWTTVTTTSQSMTSNAGYIANNSSLVTLLLPSTFNTGDLIIVHGFGSGGFTIHQNSSQQIVYGTSSSTVGTGGSLSSTNQYDVVILRGIVANTTLKVEGSVGNLTVV